jgi:hypothetical protein
MSVIETQARHVLKRFTFPLYYLLGLIIWLLALPLVGTILASEIALTAFSGLILARLTWKYTSSQTWHKIIAELFPPGVIWLLFCVGGLLNLIHVDDIIEYAPLEDSTILVMSIYALVGALCYVIGFRFIYGSFENGNVSSGRQASAVRVNLLLFFLLIFDWYVRLQLIRDGVYFTWLMRVAFDDSVRGTNLLYHVQRTIWPIIWPLLVLNVSRSQRKGFYGGLILIQLLIVMANGDRRDILFSGLILLFSYAMIYRIRIRIKLLLWGTIGGILLFGLLGPMIQEARFIMLRDARILLSDPAQIPVRFFSEYLPAVANLDVVLHPSLSYRQGILGRIGSYMNYAASINQSISSGSDPIGWKGVMTSLNLLLPRILFPSKTVVDADAVVQAHFLIGRPGFDANGTYLADAFAYLHIIGIVLLFFLGGVGFGFISKHLVKNYSIGPLILIGLLPIYVPMGDSFADLFVSLRNVLLFLLLLKFILHYQVNLQQRTKPRVSNP